MRLCGCCAAQCAAICPRVANQTPSCAMEWSRKRISPPAILPGRPTRPAMQPDGQQLGRARVPFVHKACRRRLSGNPRNRAPVTPAGRGRKAHVIGFQRVGQDQLVAGAEFHPMTAGHRHRCQKSSRTLQFQPPARTVLTRTSARYKSQPRGAAPGHFGMQADGLCNRRRVPSSSGMSRCSTHFQPMAGNLPPPADCMAATCSGLRASALGHTKRWSRARPRPVKQPVQPPEPGARARNHRSISMFQWRWPGQGAAPGMSDKKASDAASPCSRQFSPPSS